MRRLHLVGDAPEIDRPVAKIAVQVDPAFVYSHHNQWEQAAVPGDLLVPMGKTAVEAVVREKVKVDDVAGSVTTAIGPGGCSLQVVPQLHPGFVHRMSAEKGGAAEKARATWFEVWDGIDELFKGAAVSIPETDVLLDADEIAGRLHALADLPADAPVTPAYDYETWGDRDARRPDLNEQFRILTVGVGLGDPAAGDYLGYAFPLDHPGHPWPAADRRRVEEAWLRVVLRDGWAAAHNAKYEHKCNLRVFGRTGRLRCTMLMDSAIDERRDHKLNRVAARYGVKWHHYKSQSDATRKRPIEARLDDLLRYNGLDGLCTALVHDGLQADLVREGLDHVARSEEDFCRGLARLELVGMRTDSGEAAVQRSRLQESVPRLQAEFRELPEIKRVEAWATRTMKTHKKGAVFSAKSPPMMRHLCINVLGLDIKPTRKKTADGFTEQYKLDKRALEPFYESVPILGRLALVRSEAALLSGFLDKWDRYVGPDQCVHSQYNQAKVVTGRISSTDPSLHNIPNDNEVRRVFVSRYPGGSLINADFVQQEPRCVAGWAGDGRMIRAILDGLDLHGYVAAEIFGVEYAGKDTEKRDIGKRMNLGIQYGQTEYGLAKKTGMPVERARVLLRRYDDQFPGISAWRRTKHEEAMTHGYVTDLFGGRRHLPGAMSGDKWERERALRQAGNYPIQRTCAIFTFISMCYAQQLLDEAGVGPDRACVVGTVHDSLIADAAPGEGVFVTRVIREAMLIHNLQPYWRDRGCPMACDVKAGPNLFDMEAQPDAT